MAQAGTGTLMKPVLSQQEVKGDHGGVPVRNSVVSITLGAAESRRTSWWGGSPEEET